MKLYEIYSELDVIGAIKGKLNKTCIVVGRGQRFKEDAQIK